MKCIFCGSEDNKVLDSRNNDDSIRRRRECNSCGRRFTTYEIIEKIPFLIIKKDGSKQNYDSQKLKDSIAKACINRPISEQAIKNIIDEIELTLQNRNLQEVKSSTIGEMVLKELKELDQVAFIRYASVFKNFESVEDFKALFLNL